MSTSMQCISCDTTVSCKRDTSCWCYEYPAILSPQEVTSCLCPRCLHNKIIQKSAQLIQNEEFDKIASLGPVTQPIKDIDYTVEDGLWVFTAWYHLRRGHCCKSGCRECPYGYTAK